jgi:ADP-ribose pyrophosphatase YjhB (NUDIX family)
MNRPVYQSPKFHVINLLVNAYHKVITRCLRTMQWWLGASTVGVRTLVINSQQQILLLKHTYMEQWHFPGGGVFPREPARVAAVRELREESAIEAAVEDAELYGVYFHRVMRVNDYVILYVIKQFRETDLPICGEIAEVKWFDLNNLPEDLSRPTRDRIDEYFYLQSQKDYW